MVEPKTAIACRDDVELEVCLDILRREGHTSDFGKLQAPVRIYVCPKGYMDWKTNENDDLQYNTSKYVDSYEDDEDDPFEWNYVEASDIFRNQIISARIKGGT